MMLAILNHIIGLTFALGAGVFVSDGNTPLALTFSLLSIGCFINYGVIRVTDAIKKSRPSP